MADFALESGSFEDGGIIPNKFGYKHGNLSPSLKINNIPHSTKSLALIMDDPDAMQAVGKVWVHWVIYNIKPGSEFEEGRIPPRCTEGKNDFGESGYGGPAPPDGEHTYIFKLYALDLTPDLQEGLSKGQLEDLMDGHTLNSAVLTGRYSP